MNLTISWYHLLSPLRLNYNFYKCKREINCYVFFYKITIYLYTHGASSFPILGLAASEIFKRMNHVHCLATQWPSFGRPYHVHPSLFCSEYSYLVEGLCTLPPWRLYPYIYFKYVNTVLYCFRTRTRLGIHGQIYPFTWRSSWGRSLREFLKAKGYIWPYIPSPVLIRTVYHFNSHKGNNSFISLIEN